MSLARVYAGKEIRKAISDALSGSDMLKGLGSANDVVDLTIYDQVREKLSMPCAYIVYRGSTPVNKLIGDGYLMRYEYDINVVFPMEIYLKDDDNDVLLVGEDMVSYFEAVIIDIFEDDDVVPTSFTVVEKTSGGITNATYPVENGQKTYGFVIPVTMTVKIFGGN